MNRIFKSIWQSTTGTCVATSEHVTGSGHSASAVSVTCVGCLQTFGCHPLAVALMLACSTLALAEPVGGVVTAGSATVGGTSGHMTITQTTPSVALNWQSFGIKAGESVRFLQPTNNAMALNRVVGSEPSAIFGSLSSNGQVFLVNPSGILFGAGASVNVGGLVASTLNIGDANFMSGHLRFSDAGSGAVMNKGTIRAADGGHVALLGGRVDNQGVIVSRLGTVALAAGKAMTLEVAGDQLLNVAIDQGVSNAWVGNGGWLQADGGKVIMTTQVAANLWANAVNNTGVVQAQTLENRNGTIVLLGSMDTGTVNLSGRLDASGGAGQAGGRVLATAHHVGLFNAHIQASGDSGGGQVLVGGDYQGRNPDVPQAAAVYMSADSTIHADAQVQGNGGRIVLWAKDTTRAHGQISARGGVQSGQGGLVETSAHSLNVSGLRVDTRAEHGQTGTWLLDPADVTISSAVSADATDSGGVFAPDTGVSVANVNVADLVAALGSTDVTVTTSNTGGTGLGDIDVNAAVTWSAPTTLTLTAARDVNVNQPITGTDGSLLANAGRDVSVAAAVTTTTGNLAFTAVQDIHLNAATTITTGTLTAVGGRHVNVNAASTVTTGNMVFRADNDGTGPGASAGTVAVTCGSNCLTITTGELAIRFNPVSYATTNSEILAYATNLTGGGTLDAKAWVFGLGDDKLYDGTTSATVSGFIPDTTSVLPPVTLGAVSNANFDTQHVGTAKPISFDTTFADAAYDLFAPLGSPTGTYQARADVLIRPLTVTASTDTRVYNGTTSSTGAAVVAGLQLGDTLNGALTQEFASKDVLGTGNSLLVPNGTYAVSDGNGGNNYAVSVATAPGTISPAPLTTTAQDIGKLYGLAPDLVGFTVTGLVNGETVGSVTLTSTGQVATAGVVGSPYAITPSSATGGSFTPSNYSISYVDGTLTVTPAPLTITAQDVSKVYGQAPALTGYNTTALVNGETVGSVTLTSAGQAATAGVVGSPYAITPSSATGGSFTPGNYSISYVDGALTVTQAPLTITAQDVSKVYGQAPALTGFNNSALVNGETVGSVTLTSTGQVATAGVVGSPYAITAGNAEGDNFSPANYSISYLNGALTVIPATVPPVAPEQVTPFSAQQALPVLPVRPVNPVLLSVVPLVTTTLNQVVIPAEEVPAVTVIAPIPETSPLPEIKPADQPARRRLPVPVRPRKQDRN